MLVKVLVCHADGAQTTQWREMDMKPAEEESTGGEAPAAEATQ